MREAVIAAYSGPVWRMKVLDMPDRQVIAIFRSMVDDGRLGKNGKIIRKPHQPSIKIASEFVEPECQQLTIWDFYDKKGNEK